VKRTHLIGLVVAIALVVVLVMSLLDAPRRPRPEGYRSEWDKLPLLQEGDWSIDSVKRGVVQAQFFLSTEGLTHCVQRYGGSGANVKLELLVETEHGVTHLEFVEAEPRTDLPEGLVSCVTRALEAADPIPTPALAEGTKWRLELNFLVPPLADLPRVKWWDRFIPERWRTKRPVNHVG
jgi:hypothetical protein